MEGYKVFFSDWTTQHGDMVFEVGGTYRTSGPLELCRTGLHFCEKLLDCFDHYRLDPRCHVCLIEATGKVVRNSDKFGDSKACTDEMTIVREMTWGEVFDVIESSNPGFFVSINPGLMDYGMYNTGNFNVGSRNGGKRNVGSGNGGSRNVGNGNNGEQNAGNGNAGDGNSGDSNSGRRNAGSSNSGSLNAGNWNGGSMNAGNHNSGNRNVGDWNSGSGSHGCFCTERQGDIMLFDRPSGLTIMTWRRSRPRRLLDELAEGFVEDTGACCYDPADEECRAYAQSWWGALSKEDAVSILMLPNFDADKFLLCAGIDVRIGDGAGGEGEDEGALDEMSEDSLRGMDDGAGDEWDWFDLADAVRALSDSPDEE